MVHLLVLVLLLLLAWLVMPVVFCCVQDALYVDVSGKPIRSYSQYADRGGAGESESEGEAHAHTTVVLLLVLLQVLAAGMQCLTVCNGAVTRLAQDI